MKNLISKADSDQPIKFTWDYISNLMTNMGKEGFDYDTFQLLYQDDPTLQALVNDFDEEGVTLGEPEAETINPDIGTDSVHRAAMQSTRRHMNK